MFIHWGLYALLAKHEWIMHIEKIAVPEYEKLVAQFNPTKFNAEEGVSIAADAGQKYMVFTSRHHDGFGMYDTALSGYKVTNTPFRRDPAAELADPVRCSTGIIRGIIFESRAALCGRTIWNFCMDRFGNCVRALDRWPASGSMAIGR